MKLPLFGRRRKRLEALAALATVNIPKKTQGCTRCGVVAFEDSSKQNAVAGHVVTAQLNAYQSFLLCGRCALLLLELITPDKVGDPKWEAYKARKRLEWG